jgi:hypothetical protein
MPVINKAYGFFSVSCFCTSLIFVNNAGTYPSGAIYGITPIDLLANIRLEYGIDSGKRASLEIYDNSCGRFKKNRPHHRFEKNISRYILGLASIRNSLETVGSYMNNS